MDNLRLYNVLPFKPSIPIADFNEILTKPELTLFNLLDNLSKIFLFVIPFVLRYYLLASFT